MGAEAYTWITKYRKNLGDALAAAREETFAAGKFIGAGEKTATIEKAIELGAECGTGSLLDIVSVSDSPELCSVCPVSREDLLEFFGTERPSFAEIEKCMPFWESFDRGEARAVTLYENGKPTKICFAGWTIDAPAAGSGSFEDAKGRKKPKPKAEKTKTTWGLWVNPVGTTGRAFPAFVKMSYMLLELWNSQDRTDQEILQNGLHGYSENPVTVKCLQLNAALEKLLKLTVAGFYRYSVKEKDDLHSSGGRTMSFPLLLDSRSRRAASFTGGVCACRMSIQELEEDHPAGYRVTHEDVSNVSDKKEVQFGDKTILILKKKINSLFDRDELTELLSSLSAFDNDADIQIMLGDIPFIDGKPVIAETESTPYTPGVSAEEQAADLAFVKEFMTYYEKAFNAGQIQSFQGDCQRMLAIFTKYQDDMEFMQSILFLRPELLAKILSGDMNHGNL